MIRFALTFVCVMLCSASANAQDSVSDDTQLLLTLVDRYSAAIIKRDSGFLEELFSEDYSHVSQELPNGNKADVIAHFTGEHHAFSSYGCKDVSIRVNGVVAIETGTIHASGTWHGLKSIWGGIRYSRVWIKCDGAWQLLHEHRG